MKSIVLTIAILAHCPATFAQTGSVRGQLRMATAGAIRVAAMPAPGPGLSVVETSALIAITQTDSAGRFRLEDVQPGRYVIMAGNVASPTYYPGVNSPAAAQVVTVAAGSSVTGIDFEVAIKWSQETVLAARVVTEVSGQVVTDDGSSLPAAIGIAVRYATATAGGGAFTTTRADGRFSLRLPHGNHHVTVQNLPFDYAVQSIAYGALDLRHSTALFGFRKCS